MPGRTPFEKLKENLRDHRMRTILVVATTIVLLVIWAIVSPKAHALASRDGMTEPKSCPRRNDCSGELTKESWVSGTKMAQRFNGGILGNSAGYTLPLSIRQQATALWNQSHGIETIVRGKGWDCGDHWWCGPLKVENCMLNVFYCEVHNLGWGGTVSLNLECGGQAIIAGTGGTLASTPVGGLIAAGTAGTGCVYNRIGSYYGWWP